MPYPQLERRENLCPDEFYRDYVGRKPVIFSDCKDRWGPMPHWTTDWFRKNGGDQTVKVRPGYRLGAGTTEYVNLKEFLDMVAAYEEDREAGTLARKRFPPYLHDTFMPELLRAMRGDLEKFPVHYLPQWYHREWTRFMLFFIGPSDTFTPLHFDTCETNNLFFQVVGRKRFIIVRPEHRSRCYAYDWRWSPVKAEDPNYDEHPLFKDAAPVQCEIGPGEILYLPPGSFHEVRSLESSISFNLDWHTRRSAISGSLAVFRGMPLRYVFYNLMHAVGMCGRIPCRWVYPLLRSHLNTVD